MTRKRLPIELELQNVQRQSFDYFLHEANPGSRNGVHNPAEFVLLTRAFVILESMIGRIDPQHDYMVSFRGEIARLAEQHFAARRVMDKSTQLARNVERLILDAPSDMRRVLQIARHAGQVLA